nr:acyl carrier protein [uncultured Noviherbaspirillum sp.]
MNASAKQQLREFIDKALASQGDRAGFSDDEALFSSGRLDSFTMMNLVMYLEQTFGIDFANVEFDIELVDSIDAVEALVDARAMV